MSEQLRGGRGRGHEMRRHGDIGRRFDECVSANISVSRPDYRRNMVVFAEIEDVVM